MRCVACEEIVLNLGFLEAGAPMVRANLSGATDYAVGLLPRALLP